MRAGSKQLLPVWRIACGTASLRTVWFFRTRTILLIASACQLLAACDEKCENGFKIKTDYKTVFYRDSWFDSPKDTVLDGAVRVETWSYKSGRSLTFRCFQDRTGSFTQYDLRYSINAPLLKRLAEDLQKEGDVQLVVSVDGTAAANIKVRTVPQDSGIDFLGQIQPSLIDTFATAKETIVAMPRQNNEKLDDLIEFGVANLQENLGPVKKACAGLLKVPQDIPAQEPSESKDPKEIKETKNSKD